MKTEKHPKLANGQPAISCFALSQAEVVRRLQRAHERADLLGAEECPLNERQAAAASRQIGRSLLWHVDFPPYLLALVCDNDLFRLTADLPDELLVTNGGQELDFWDYAYVADVLRDWLTRRELPGERQNLRRALAWAEERGSMLRDYSQEED